MTLGLARAAAWFGVLSWRRIKTALRGAAALAMQLILSDVGLAAHYGLNSNIVLGPKSANT
jgi:hypothetical protein